MTCRGTSERRKVSPPAKRSTPGREIKRKPRHGAKWMKAIDCSLPVEKIALGCKARAA